MQTGLGGGTPPQGSATGDMGTYSGTGVTDDGNGMTFTFDPLSAGVGVHTLTYDYIDANNCTSSATTTVEVFALPIVDAGSYGPVCEDAPDVTLIGSPVPGASESGTWTGSGVTDASTSDETAVFDPTGLSGNIILTYSFTDINGCTDFSSTTIVVNDLPVVAPSANDICADGTDLNLFANVTSANPPFIFDWTGPNGQTSDEENPVFTSATVNESGTWVVNVTDVNGCMTSGSVDVNVFPQPVLSVSDCFCEFDPNINNYGSQVVITVNSGTAPYTVTTTAGILTETSLVDNQPATLFLGANGGSYTVTITDANGCSASMSNTCEACDFELEISDPCSCNNDQSYNGAQDGTFGELVEVMGPPGLNLIVGAGSTGLNGINIGDDFTEAIPGVYQLRFNHTDIVGYTIFIEGRSGNITFPINDASGNQLTVSNACQYPVITDPVLDEDAFCYNGEPVVFTGNEVTEVNGFAGSVEVYLGGVSTGTQITEFDPSLYPKGVYTLTFLFTGDFIDNMGGTPANPAFPGCQTQTSIQVGIGGGGSLSCNDNVNMTVNADCELDFSWFTLLESDDVPDVFNAEFYNSAGALIDESDLGSFAGSTVTFSIVDMCNGNSCWGSINIEDKNDPVIDCEICPVINGSSAIDYDPDCVLSCYEQPILQLRYDDGLRDDLIQEDYEDFADDAMSDNCDNWNEDEVSFYDEYENLGDCVGTRLTRTWTVGFTRADGSSGSVSCQREYFFAPLDISTARTYDLDPFTELPIIEPIEDTLVLPPGVIELPCGVDISPAGIAAFFDIPLSIDRDTDDNNIDPDELDIDLVVENNEGFPWAYPHYYQDGVGSGGPHAQKIDNEVCTLISGYTDTEIEACAPGCDGNRKILREWVILDWCTAEFIEYSQVIKSVDVAGPVLTVPNASYSVDPWDCTVNALLPAPEHIGDDCDDDVSYYIGNTGGYDVSGDAQTGYTVHGLPLGTHTIEYRSEDCCGNVGSTTMTVTVVDNTAPVAVSKEFIVLSLSNVGNPVDEFQGFAKIYAEDVDNGSYDGCTDVTLEIRRDGTCDVSDTEWGPFVSFCCEDLQGGSQANIDVELKIEDANGNYNIVWATVLLEDKSATIPVIPPHMFLTCDMDYNDFSITGGLPRFFGACGEAQIECDTAEVIENTEPRELRLSDGVVIDGIPQEAPAYDPSCGFGAVRRQFRDCGGGEQWFVIRAIDPFDASTITFPDDVVVDCDDAEVGEPSWEEATCNLIGVTLSSDTFLFEDGACFKILNHWSVINWCTFDPSNPTAGGRYDHTQEIKIIDTEDPVLTVVDSLCFAVDVNCESKDVSMGGSAVDMGDCSSNWLKWEVSIDMYADWTEDYNYATSNPRLLPTGEPNPYHIPASGNGESATITLPDGLPTSKIWHRSVWRVFDGCGNTASATRYFQITDKKAPTPYCLNLSSAVMSNGEVELWAIDFNVGSFDNCTDSDNLLFTFTDVPPPPRNDEEYDSNDDLMWYNGTFWYYNSEEIDLATGAGEYESQDAFGGEVHRWEPGLRSSGAIFTADMADANGFVQIPIYVWDECGNIDFCVVNLRLVDNGGGGMAMVSGQVVTEQGEEVEQIETNLTGPSNYLESDMTDASGQYAFANTPLYSSYEVSGTKTDDYLNGVSTLDLVLIQRHILGQNKLDSPYKMIAADINKDNEITTIDLLELRKLILGIYSELPNNASWTLVNSDNTLTVDNPWNYEETISIQDLAQDMDDEDFIGVKIGDVNGSVVANIASEGVVSRNRSIDIHFEDRVVSEGEQVTITLSTERNDVYGYQFTLNTTGLELVEVAGNNLTQSNVGVFANRLTLSYNEDEAINSGDLVSLVVKARQAGQLGEMITMGSELTRAEAYVGSNLDVVDITLRDNEETEFALYQNEPNPFRDYTVIGFDMPSNGEATISLFDVTGKVLKVIEGNYTAGYNSVKVSKEDVGVAGMVYYKLQAGEHTATKHMVVIK